MWTSSVPTIVQVVEPLGADRLDADRDRLDILVALLRGDDDVALIFPGGRPCFSLDGCFRRGGVGRRRLGERGCRKRGRRQERRDPNATIENMHACCPHDDLCRQSVLRRNKGQTKLGR